MILSEKEAQESRAKIEELYVPHKWAAVRGRARELAREVQYCMDLGGSPSGLSVKELCELVLRAEQEPVDQSWEDVRQEAQKLAREAAEIERKARSGL